MGDICSRHDVTVVADEIHCELTRPGTDYTPFAALSPEFQNRAVVCNSPSKAFNLAGMQTANIIAADPELRRRIDRAVNDNEVCDIGPFGVAALIAAYDHGAEWLDVLRAYLWENYRCVRDFFAAELPDFSIAPLEATYLVWIDCRATCRTSEELAQHLVLECRLMVSPGRSTAPKGRLSAVEYRLPAHVVDRGAPATEKRAARAIAWDTDADGNTNCWIASGTVVR